MVRSENIYVRVHLMIGLNIFKILLVFPLIYFLILWIKSPRFLFYDSNIRQDFTVVQSKTRCSPVLRYRSESLCSSTMGLGVVPQSVRENG